MATSADTGSALSALDVVIPIGLKRTLRSPEAEVRDAIDNSGSLTKILIAAKPNKKDQKRRLDNCHVLADWLECHGSQLTELVLSMR